MRNHAMADTHTLIADRLLGDGTDAYEYSSELERIGIDLSDITRVLERQGVQKFKDAWAELRVIMGAALAGY